MVRAIGRSARDDQKIEKIKMKKTATISIGGSVFHIEEDAYERLDDYLQSIRNHFYKPREGEVVSDIEAAIADRFGDKKGSVVTISEVEEAIKAMGTIRDIDGTEPREDPNQDKAKKRLYRDKENQMIGGVASGMAAFMSVDPTIVRLAFVALAFINGIGVLAYFLFWLVVPRAETRKEKEEMRGGFPTTIKEIEEKAKKEARNISGSSDNLLSRFGKILEKIFAAFARIFWLIIRVSAVFVGGIMSVTGIAILCGSVLFAAIMLTSSGYYLDVSIFDVMFPWQAIMAIISGLLVMTIPAGLLISFGVSFIRQKPNISGGRIFGSIGLWIVAMTALIFVIVSSVPRWVDAIDTYNNVPAITAERQVSSFDMISVSDGVKAEIVKGDSYRVELIGSERAITRTVVGVEEEKLSIRTDRDSFIKEEDGKRKFCFLCGILKPVSVRITTPSVNEIEARNGSSVSASDIDQTSLSLKATSGSLIKVTGLSLDSIEVSASYGSEISLEGEADNISLSADSGSNIDAYEIASIKADISATSGSSIKANVSERINADISIGSSLFHKGGARVIDISDKNKEEVDVIEEETKGEIIRTDSQ